MKPFLINSLVIVAVPVCAALAPVETREAANCSGTLPPSASRRITGVIPAKRGETLLIITKEDYGPPFEKCLRVVVCDLDGRILEQASIVSEGYYFTATRTPEVPLVGIDSRKSKGLWVAQYAGGQLQQSFFGSAELDADTFMNKCWFLEVQGEKKLFVQASAPEQVKGKNELGPSETCWLYCYRYVHGHLEFDGKVLVGSAKSDSDEMNLECAQANSGVYIWVCKEGGDESIGLLRVAKWPRDRDSDLKWTECYRGRKGEKLRELSVDALSGCDAAVFTYRERRWTASCTLCQIKDDNNVACADLGDKFVSFPAKKQLLRVAHGDMAWLLLHALRIVVVDGNLDPVREISSNFSNVSDVHLFRGNDARAYIVEATEGGRFIVRRMPAD
jgi:hypothetical protein